VSERLPEQPDGRFGFVGHVNVVFLTNVANAGLSFVVAVLLARALGPEARGAYGQFLLTASIAQAMFSLGLGVAAIYDLGRNTYPSSRIVANCQQVTIASFLLTTLLVLIAWPFLGDWTADEGVPLWAFIVAVPLFVQYGLLTSVLQGQQRFLAMNVVVVAQPLLLLALLLAAMAFGDVDTRDAVIVWCVATLAANVIAMAFLGRDALPSTDLLRLDWPSMRAQLGFGVRGQVGNFAQLLNYRVDQYVVRIFAGLAGVGIYIVSVQMSITLWFLSNAVATVLQPRLTAATEEDAAREAPVVCRATLLVTGVGAGALAVVSPWLIPWLFGDEFESAVVPFLWLLPGTVALAGSKILSSYVFARGFPGTNSVITTVTLAVTLAADFALVPFLEVTGAAIASSIAYVVHFMLSLGAYQRISGRPAWEAVLVRVDDLRSYVELARSRIAPAGPSL
jgi:O-antigen/teichoic acid export membrane protein